MYQKIWSNCTSKTHWRIFNFFSLFSLFCTILTVGIFLSRDLGTQDTNFPFHSNKTLSHCISRTQWMIFKINSLLLFFGTNLELKRGGPEVNRGFGTQDTNWPIKKCTKKFDRIVPRKPIEEFSIFFLYSLYFVPF